MDQHDIGLFTRKRFKARMHRGLARGAARSGRSMAEPGAGRVEHGVVVWVKHRLNDGNLRMDAERLHRAKDDALAADHPILLRASSAGAQPAAGCNEDGCGAFRIRMGRFQDGDFALPGEQKRGGVGQRGRPYHVASIKKRAIAFSP